MFTTSVNLKTVIWRLDFSTLVYAFLMIYSVLYYYFTGLGITAGYHRLWAHRSYNASVPLQYALSIAGAGAVQGSIKWWSRGHRAHHRYTDTKLDPYSAHEGFWWSHVGWMLMKPRGKIGVADISDLTRNKDVRWQHKNYLALLLTMGFVFPTVVAGFGWGDWRGGFFFAATARLVFVHHVSIWFYRTASWLTLAVNVLRQFACPLARRQAIRQQAHSLRSLLHCALHHRRGVPQLPPPISDGFPQRH